MNRSRVSRRSLIFGGASAVAASAFPMIAMQAPGTASRSSMPSPDRAAWMQDPRYCWGVMTHYLADWQAREHKLDMDVNLWNKLVDRFDVEGMAKRLESVGAGHYQLSIGQNSGYYLSPSAAYDRITGNVPSKCSRRDLVADFYEPLHKRDIKLMVYLPSGGSGPGHERARRAGMVKWPTSEQELSTQVAAGGRGVVAALGEQGGWLVVRWLLFSQCDVSFRHPAEFHQLCGSSEDRQFQFQRGVQSWRHLPHCLGVSGRRLHRGRD